MKLTKNQLAIMLIPDALINLAGVWMLLIGSVISAVALFILAGMYTVGCLIVFKMNS